MVLVYGHHNLPPTYGSDNLSSTKCNFQNIPDPSTGMKYQCIALIQETEFTSLISGTWTLYALNQKVAITVCTRIWTFQFSITLIFPRLGNDFFNLLSARIWYTVAVYYIHTMHVFLNRIALHHDFYIKLFTKFLSQRFSFKGNIKSFVSYY